MGWRGRPGAPKPDTRLRLSVRCPLPAGRSVGFRVSLPWLWNAARRSVFLSELCLKLRTNDA